MNSTKSVERPTLDEIEDAVLPVFGIEKEEFNSKMKCRLTVYRNCRYYVWLFAKASGETYVSLERRYPKTHADILHGVNRLLCDIERNKAYRKTFNDVVERINKMGYLLPDDWVVRVAKKNRNVNNF